ncbi:MAG: flagellar biosynthetic protein FliO [Desulfobacteraceae bacterium]|nr:flagellar biosynthetic protein FliO [Desulfobacteraceae bacterium]
MSASSEIWIAFARTFFMLFVVLVILVLFFYCIRRFSNRGGNGDNGFISVLAVHYISPKEKILLLDVLNEKILVGVTPQKISQLATIDNDIGLIQKKENKNMKFADFLPGKFIKDKDKK